MFTGATFALFHIPGHSPGSVAFYLPAHGLLVGGDVLFAGGIGRWDLPGGNGALLVQGIKQKLFPLPEDTLLLPGHGPTTTIGRERATNPFLAD
ncbi:MAG: MBL fold metallo-hydrolase [Verrucomicrobiia bacterium]